MEEKKKYHKLELESRKLILGFIKDDGIDHKVFFEKNKDTFGPDKSAHRLRCEKFYHDTKRRVYPDPVKFKQVLVKYGVVKMGKKTPSKKKPAKKPAASDSEEEVDEVVESDDEEEEEEEEERSSCEFVGSPKPKSKARQPSSTKKSATPTPTTTNKGDKGE
jgi:hypothetical protein